MRVLIFAVGRDTGGVAIGIKRAFDHFGGDWTVRTVREANNLFDYPADIVRSSGTQELVADLMAQADVIHLMNRPTWHPLFEGKGLVLHHHGTYLRDHAPALRGWAAEHRAVQLVATIDLLADAPEATWLPSPVDVPAMEGLRRTEYRRGDRLRLAHAPTDRSLKGTAGYLAALGRLGNRVESDLIEGVDWPTCLRRKAAADIFFDQVGYGYGMNALEAWAMGLPVLSGTNDWRITRLIRNTVGYLPYHPASDADIAERLAELVDDPRLRRWSAERGNAYVRDFHDEPRVVERLKRIYEQAAA